MYVEKALGQRAGQFKNVRTKHAIKAMSQPNMVTVLQPCTVTPATLGSGRTAAVRHCARRLSVPRIHSPLRLRPSQLTTGVWANVPRVQCFGKMAARSHAHSVPKDSSRPKGPSVYLLIVILATTMI